MMSPTDLAAEFNESFKCCVNDPLFIDRFYELFLSSSGEVKLMFKDTDMETQKAMLHISMAYMTKSHEKKSEILLKIANSHNKNNLNIRPHLYSLWLDSLVSAAKSINHDFDNNTEKLWRTCLQPGIDLMISRYQVV